MRAAQSAQAEAERLVETYSDMILRLSYTYLKNRQDAEDICQDVLIKLLTGAEHFTSREHEKAWILRTAANACKDLLKSAHRRVTCDLDSCPEQAAPECSDHSVLEAVQSLPEKYREVIFLHYYMGYSLQEIGAILSLPAATVGTRLARAREQLKTILGGEIYEQQCV